MSRSQRGLSLRQRLLGRRAVPGPTTADRVLADVRAGELHIVTHPGTSQYSVGGVAACGLAAMNAARILAELWGPKVQGRQLIELMIEASFCQVRIGHSVQLFQSTEIRTTGSSLYLLKVDPARTSVRRRPVRATCLRSCLETGSRLGRDLQRRTVHITASVSDRQGMRIPH